MLRGCSLESWRIQLSLRLHPFAPEPPQKDTTVQLPRDVAMRLDSLLSALLHHHTSLEVPVERAEAHLLIDAVRYAYEHSASALSPSDAGWREKVRPYLRHTEECELENAEIIAFEPTETEAMTVYPIRRRTEEDPPAQCTCGLTSLITETGK